MATVTNRLAQLLGINERDVRHAILPPAMAAEVDARERTTDEAARAALIASRAETVKRHEKQAPIVAKKMADAKAKRDAAAQALKLAEAELNVAIVEQHNLSFRTSSALDRAECELRMRAAECIAAAIHRISEDEEATRRGVVNWEDDRGSEYRDNVRFIHRTNRDKVNARLAALRDARLTINELPLKFASVADMETAIADIFEALPTIG